MANVFDVFKFYFICTALSQLCLNCCLFKLQNLLQYSSLPAIKFFFNSIFLPPFSTLFYQPLFVILCAKRRFSSNVGTGIPSLRGRGVCNHEHDASARKLDSNRSVLAQKVTQTNTTHRDTHTHTPKKKDSCSCRSTRTVELFRMIAQPIETVAIGFGRQCFGKRLSKFSISNDDRRTPFTLTGDRAHCTPRKEHSYTRDVSVSKLFLLLVC